MALVNGNRVQVCALGDDLVRAGHVAGGEPVLGVGDKKALTVAVVDYVLEGTYALAPVVGLAEPPDQPLGLAAEHAAGDDFQPGTGRSVWPRHRADPFGED